MKTQNSSDRDCYLALLPDVLADYTYALLKYTGSAPTSLPSSSDVDLLVREADLTGILQLVQASCGAPRFHSEEFEAVTFVSIYFFDGSFLRLDLATGFVRKGIEYLEVGSLLDATQSIHGGWKIPRFDLGFEYTILFYLTNGASVPEKHRKVFLGMPKAERDKLRRRLERKYDLSDEDSFDLLDLPDSARAKIIRKIRRHPKNGWIRYCKRYARYVRHVVKVRARTPIITVSGVDGAGKSTWLDYLVQRLTIKYRRRVVVRRHRPGILPIISAWKYGRLEAEKVAGSRLPRQGSNRSRVGSILRLAYYLADVFLGQVILFVRHTLRGEIVLYDRYFFDFIVDSKRSNICISGEAVRPFYSLVFKPRLNFLFVANPRAIFLRKSELDLSTINDLQRKYVGLFRDLGNTASGSYYCIVPSAHIVETSRILDRALHEFL